MLLVRKHVPAKDYSPKHPRAKHMEQFQTFLQTQTKYMLFAVQIHTLAWGVIMKENKKPDNGEGKLLRSTDFGVINSVFVWSKHLLSAIKSRKFYCVVRTQPNRTHLL